MAIYFLNAEFNYPQKLVDEVCAAVDSYINETVQDLPVRKPFDITIYPNHHWTEEATGVDGHAMSGGLLQIRVDLRGEIHPIPRLLKEPLKAAVFHETNHIARHQGPGYGKNLLEATVSEGLATVYEKLKSGLTHLPHADYSDLEMLLEFYKKRDRADDAVYNHEAWFLGFDPKYPKSLGYKIGTYVVEQAQEKRPDLTIQQMTVMPAADILKLSEVPL